MSTDFLRALRERARAGGPRRVVLAEGADARMIRAAVVATEQRLAQVILLGRPAGISRVARLEERKLSGIEIVDPETSPLLPQLAAVYREGERGRTASEEEAEALLRQPAYFAAMLVRTRMADGMVAGAVSTSADTVRAALTVIGPAPGRRLISSFFLMALPHPAPNGTSVLFYADCGVVPRPSPEELADIAVLTADRFRAITGQEPRVALLSYSTKGSATHPSVDRVVEAVARARALAPDLALDGELQADAALVPAVGRRKAPDSKVAGEANVLIFPDLNSGNIAYKLTERLAGARAIGPILMGTAQPVSDLSRGCTAEDILDAIAITVLQAP